MLIFFLCWFAIAAVSFLSSAATPLVAFEHFVSVVSTLPLTLPAYFFDAAVTFAAPFVLDFVFSAVLLSLCYSPRSRIFRGGYIWYFPCSSYLGGITLCLSRVFLRVFHSVICRSTLSAFFLDLCNTRVLFLLVCFPASTLTCAVGMVDFSALMHVRHVVLLGLPSFLGRTTLPLRVPALDCCLTLPTACTHACVAHCVCACSLVVLLHPSPPDHSKYPSSVAFLSLCRRYGTLGSPLVS